MPGKRIHIESISLDALELLASDEGKSLQELMEEAVADLLKKHRRPVGLKNALRESLRRAPANANARRAR